MSSCEIFVQFLNEHSKAVRKHLPVLWSVKEGTLRLVVEGD